MKIKKTEKENYLNKSYLDIRRKSKYKLGFLIN